MKNSEIISALIGTSFFAIPYLALSIPVIPSIAIGMAAFTAGELVLKQDKKTILRKTNNSLYKQIELAKKQNDHILRMIPVIDNKEIKQNLNEINDTVSKIIKVIEENPKKENKLKNFFDYYLPVTVKLIDRYDEIENQNITSKETKKFNESTNNMIKEINMVFKKFLNKLYSSEMVDTKVEIKVLNSMLKADGLGKNELDIAEDNNE